MEHNYEMEDDHFLLHEDDPHLPTTKIPLPKFTGDITKVYNYGLPPEQQFYPYEVMPDTLANFEMIYREAKNIKPDKSVKPSDLRKYLEDNQVKFSEEIKWIKRVTHHRYHGQWVFIKGKLIYIQRWHYFFVNFNYISSDNEARNGFPDFRDRDRRFFIAEEHYYNDTKGYFKYKVSYVNEKGEVHNQYFNNPTSRDKFCQGLAFRKIHALREEGYYEQEMNERTCLGTLYYKHRREGATYKAQCISFLIQQENPGKNTAFQSKSDDHTMEVMDTKVHEPYKRVPFFFMNDYLTVPKTIFSKNKIEWKTDSKIRGKKDHGGFHFNAGAGEYVVDGMKLIFWHGDEIAKKDPTTRMNMLKRWNIVRKTLSQGNGKVIKGFSIHTSTVGEMGGGGGELALKLAKQSMIENSDDQGRTVSGCRIVFFSAADCLEGFVDQYGFSVIEDPVEPVLGIDGKWIKQGAKSYLLSVRLAKEQMEDWDGLNEDIRQFPLYFMECFRESTTETPFNIELINRFIERMQMLKEPATKRYNLRFSSGWGSPVEMHEDPFGRWSFSTTFERRNQFIMGSDGYQPSPDVYGKRVLGADPMKYHAHEVSHGKMSNGGGAIWYDFDGSVDNGKPRDKWISQKFEGTYNTRTDDKFLYAEDMAAACVLTGSLCFPENNFNLISDEFQRNNMRGYLIFEIDNNGNESNKAGATTSSSDGNIVQQMFSFGSWYINNALQYDNHLEIAQEYAQIKSPKDITNYDLFTAASYAGVGSRTNFIKFAREQKTNNVNLSHLFPNYKLM
jgi:hypothetical protein